MKEKNKMDTMKIIEMCEDGFSYRRIANILDYPYKDVKKYIEDNGIKLKKEIFTEDAIPKIKRLYKEGVAALTLGRKYSIRTQRVLKWAEEDGTLRKQGDATRTVEYNQHIFDIIDDQDKAYWLGFLYADGYNLEGKKVELSLCTDDIDHIKKLANFVGISEKQISSRIDKDGHKQSTLNMFGKHMSEQLAKWGCVQKKSLILTYPKWLPNDLHQHFIRGEFDGDGSINVDKEGKDWRICIVGTKDMMDNISNIITANINITSIIEKRNKNDDRNTYSLVINGNNQVQKFCDWIYKDHKTRLDRKYEKYLILTEQQKRKENIKNNMRKNYVLTEIEIEQIKQYLINKIDIAEIAEKLNIHQNSVRNIKNKMQELPQ
jgi:predicted transcriptional regulator